jgi:hypothetical protein
VEHAAAMNGKSARIRSAAICPRRAIERFARVDARGPFAAPDARTEETLLSIPADGDSGNVRLDALTGDLDTTIGGSGAVRIEHGRIGRADISIGGSGSVTLGEGAVDHASVQIGGAGDVRFPGPVGRLDVELGGAGNVSVAGNVGDVNAQIAGVGRVQVGAVTGNLEQQVVGFGGVNVGH